jgi:hypothetical protein
MIHAWLDMPIGGIFAVLALIYGAITVAIHWLTFRSPWRTGIQSLKGVVAPYFTAIALICALLIGFLAADVSNRNRQAAETVLAESNALLTLDILSRASDKVPAGLRAAIHRYAEAVVQDEWARMDEADESSRTTATLTTLMQLVAEPVIGRDAGQALHNNMLAAAIRASTARSERLALNADRSRDFKWVSVLILSVLTLVAIAMVHLEFPRAQAAALGLFTIAVVIALGMIAIQEHPFDGPLRVSQAPLEAAMKTLMSGP